MERAARVGYEPIAQSLWNDSAAREHAFPALCASQDAEVAIIGGGYSGLVCALSLVEQGLKVVVLEAEQPGWAASGRNSGQVIPMMWGAHKTPEAVEKRFGADVGARMNRAVAQAGRVLFELIERYNIQCDSRQGYVVAMRSERSWNRWKSVFESWARYDGQSQPLDRSQLQRYTTSPRYAGGFFLPEGGQLNPLGLARGLAQAVVARGGQIFGSSRVESIQPENGGWTVRTAQGAVRCKTAIATLGAYANGLIPELRSIGYPVTCGVAATDKLPDRGATMYPAGVPVADMDDPAVFSPMIDAGGRLVVSYLLGNNAPDTAQADRVIGPRMHRAFPDLEAPRFSRTWAGRFLISPGGMPSVLKLKEGLYASAVCNGLGHTLGITAALELAKLVAGARDDELALPVQAAKATPMHGMMPAVLRNIVFPLANRLGA